MRKSSLTPDAIEVIRLEYLTAGPAVLSQRLGVSNSVVVAAAKKLGLRINKKPGVIDDLARDVIRERFVAEGPHALAKELDLNHATVTRVAKEMGLRSDAWKKDWLAKRDARPKAFDVAFFDEWSAGMAYVLGFTFADGSVHKDMTSVGWEISIVDVDILEAIKRLTSSTLPIKVVKRGRKVDNVKFHLSSTRVANRLAELGCHPNKTHRDDPFPDVPDEYLPHFLRGAFDGDGSISKARKAQTWAFSYVGSPRFVRGYHDVLCRLAGVKPKTVSKTPRSIAYRVSWAARDEVKKIHDVLYPSQDVTCCARKRDTWHRFLVDYNGEQDWYYFPF